MKHRNHVFAGILNALIPSLIFWVLLLTSGGFISTLLTGAP